MAVHLDSDGRRWDALSLVRRATSAQREALLREGTAPSLDSLVGWEFAGTNVPWFTALLGIRKFKKGFYRGAPRVARGPEPFVQGYNVPVRQNGIGAPHLAKPSEEHPKRFGFYRVYQAGLHPRRKYPNALLLDYGLGRNFPDPAFLLRDFLVQVHPDDPDLLLGKAYGAVGLWIPIGFFVLRRHNRHDFEG